MSVIKTLLITGENNHDWRRTSSFCKKLLERTGFFQVDVTENPARDLADTGSLSNYHLFFLDYNGPDWGEPAKSNLEAAVHDGAGLVVLHAANNAFPDWVAYEKMIGLAWREGAGHGEFHKFKVEITEHDHPVTQGLQDFETWDELYHGLMHMHQAPYQVLARAYSDPKTGGTGQDEPIIIVLEYGRGRVFHLMLGHVWPGDANGSYRGASLIALENEGFQSALKRGCAWAATGAIRDEQR